MRLRLPPASLLARQVEYKKAQSKSERYLLEIIPM